MDAIESFQWEESKKEDSKFKYSLDQELSLENLTILKSEKIPEKSEPLNEEAKYALMQEFGLEHSESVEVKVQETITEEIESGEIIEESEIEVEEEVKAIIQDMEEILKPVETIIDIEPLVIIRMREYEAPSFLTSDITQKNVMSYSFEIFDNGTGMTKLDLKKFGKYLASSKSMRLKQTRGSQGFGAPSAFSDAQNTTGRPVVAVSKSIDNIYATASEFLTTSKNEKKYLIHPTDIDSQFFHGTYIKLHYLNVKYIRGYVDTYIKETAFMNPHITIVYLDPYGEEFIYPRKVSSFPKEPKYAKPHPSSSNIGDLQDFITKSEHLTVSSFLQDNFVRISSKTAKQIISLAERDLQDKLNILILKNGFVNITKNKTDEINFLRFEKRVFGRSAKPRDKLIIYKGDSEELKNQYQELISRYNNYNKEVEKINNNIKKKNSTLEKAETQKERKKIRNDIKNFFDEINGIRKEKDKIKLDLNNLFQNVKTGLVELKKVKNREEFEELVNQVQISKTRPLNLTNDQFNSLFLAFKSVKYMAPPTDTAIPVGDTVLENTLIKEIGLRVSENLDDFDFPVESWKNSVEILKEQKKNDLIKEDPKIDENVLNNIVVEKEEIINLNSKILSNIDIEDQSFQFQQAKQSIEEIIKYSELEAKDTYQDVFEFFLENYTKDDDFVTAETRDPTSGKGLAYVVEAVMAYSKNLEVPKRSRDVLSRFVNRTPKLRDSADCAITKAVQSVNWKNYKLDTYDNNLPKGPIKLLVNVSGPFVHLMFKSQSKNALADDENLIKEMKYCLEAIGRRLRAYINRKQAITRSEKRSSLIEKYVQPFVKSLFSIAKEGSKYKDDINVDMLQTSMKEAIGQKISPPTPQPIQLEISKLKITKPLIKKVEIVEIKGTEEITKDRVEKIEKLPEKGEILEGELKTEDFEKFSVKHLIDFAKKNKIPVLIKARKADLIKIIENNIEKRKKPIGEPIVKVTPTIQQRISSSKPTWQKKTIVVPKVEKPITSQPILKPQKPASPPGSTQTQLPIITTDRILNSLSNEWQTIKHLIFKLKIKDMMDARFLQIKLKELERKEKVFVDVRMGKKHWKLK